MRVVSICVWLNLLCIYLAPVKSGAPKVGPYEFRIKELHNCEDEGTGQIYFHSKITKARNGKYVYNETFRFGVPIDQDLKIKAEIQTWGNQGWRPRFMEYTMNDCEGVWKIAHEFIQSLWKSAGVTVTQCPVPAGNYTAHNWEIEFGITAIKVMPYGKLRAILTFIQKTTKVGCIASVYDVVPKPK